MTELRREMSGQVVTYTAKYTYAVEGNDIRFDNDPPCPINAICRWGPPTGRFVNSYLLVDFSGGGGSPLYEYRFIPPD